MKKAPYIQHEGKVIDAKGRFAHVMALALDPRSGYADGVIRCIVKREGDVAVSGYIDRSQLYRVKAASPERIALTEPLQIRGADAVIDRLSRADGEQGDFLGLEDPDIFRGEDGKLHLYFTLPFRLHDRRKKYMGIDLGHAVGSSLDDLQMTEPALMGDREDLEHSCAKELSIAPPNSAGVRLNLVESYSHDGTEGYSVVRTAIARDMGAPWRFGELAFHPKDHGIPWIGGHASPGPLLPREFIDLGPDRLLGIMNGREANRRSGGRTEYGIFSVGLFIYDYERGRIEWVSPEPLIRDTEARTITFASQFVPGRAGQGILYAHVDDSFVRAYALFAEGMSELLP